VLDTCTLILLGRFTDLSELPDEAEITAVTLAELSVGPLVARTDLERAARQSHVQMAENDFIPLPFDADAARAFGRVAASLRRAGRKPAARAYDAMIAATAIANGLAVYTCNPSDFSDIDELDVVPVRHPDRSSSASSMPSNET
jgi:tRNA(fMet)-specific endonuclease VapC